MSALPVLRSLLFGSSLRAALTLVLLAGLAVGAWLLLRPAPDPDARWRTVVLERGPLAQRVTATGTLQPTGQVSVGTQVSGTIAAVRVDFNQEVKAGQILAEIDPSLLASALKQTLAGLQNAQAQLLLARDAEERARTLLERAFVSRPQLDAALQQREAAQAAVEVAEAQVERARTDLRNAVIRSPVAGVVIARKVDVGQTVAANFQIPDLFVIARDLREMEIHASVSEADVGAVRTGLPVEFRVDAFTEQRFSGTVRQVRLNARSEQGVVTYTVVITADNAERLLLPGMTARVEITASQKDAVLRLPNAALRFRPTDEGKAVRDGRAEGAATAGTSGTAAGEAGGSRGAGRSSGEPDVRTRVYKLEGGHAVRVEVRTGISDSRYTELVDGALAAGDRLIVRDLQSRQPGEINIGL